MRYLGISDATPKGNCQLASATWFGGLNLMRILLKYLPTLLTLSELEKELFSLNFRLSLANGRESMVLHYHLKEVWTV